MDSIFTVKEILRKPNSLSFDFYIILADELHAKYIARVHPRQKDAIARGCVFINDTVRVTKIVDNAIQFETVNGDLSALNAPSAEFINGTPCQIQHCEVPKLKECSKNDTIITKEDLYEYDNPLQEDARMNVLEEYFDSQRYRYYPYLTDVPEIVREIEIVPFQGLNAASVAEAGNRILPVHGKVIYKSRVLTCKGSHPFFFFIVMKSGYQTLNAFFWNENVGYHGSIRSDDVIVLKNYKRKKKIVGECSFINSFSEIFLWNGKYVDLKGECEVFSETDVKKCNNILNSSYFNRPYVDIEGTVELMGVLMRKRCKINSFGDVHDKIMDFHYCLIGDTIVVLFNNSQPEFSQLKSGATVSIKNLWKVKRGKTAYCTSSLFTEIKILSQHGTKIDNILCFMPDDYEHPSDILDPKANGISGIEIDAVSFNNIETHTISEVAEIASNLVINEQRKIIIKGTLTGVHLTNLFLDESCTACRFTDTPPSKNVALALSYLHNENEVSVNTGFARVTDDRNTIDLLVFSNFLVGESCEDILVRICGCSSFRELDACLNREFVFTVDLFRNDHNSVLIYISKGFLCESK